MSAYGPDAGAFILYKNKIIKSGQVDKHSAVLLVSNVSRHWMDHCNICIKFELND